MSPTRSRARTKTLALWGLIAVNGGLAVAVAGKLAGRGALDLPSALPGASVALGQQAMRRPGKFIIIPGRVQGSSSEVVYIFDTANGELSASAYNGTNGQLDFLPKISIADIFQNAVRNERPAAGGGNRNRR